MKTVTEHFLQMVQINSPSGEERQMGAYLTDWLTKMNMDYFQDAKGSILARHKGKGEPMLLCAHMDTVSPGKNIKPVIKNGIVQSGGNTVLGADNKASLAAIVSAVEEVVAVGASDKPFELLFTVKEETGGGIEFFPFGRIKSKTALVFDSANPLGGIVLRSPYITNFKATFMGEAAHSSKPHEGKNALLPAVAAMSRIPQGLIESDETTINIGLIGGGVGINTIPDRVVFEGEIRSYGKLSFDGHIEKIKKIVHRAAGEYKTPVKLVFSGYCGGYAFAENDPFTRKVADIIERTGLQPEYHGKSGVSDANVLNAHGIKTLNIADGVRNPHTVKERIAVADLNGLKDIIKNCLIQL